MKRGNAGLRDCGNESGEKRECVAGNFRVSPTPKNFNNICNKLIKITLVFVYLRLQNYDV